MTDPLSILVVDDNRSTANAMVLVLRRAGHRAQATYDGQSAIEALRPGAYQLVLTDLRMEPVDGLEVVRAARSLQPPPEVIVFTAFGSVNSAVEAMQLGARDFLTKPVSAQEILDRISTLKTAPAAASSLPWIGAAAPSSALLERLEEISELRSTLLLLGEPGAGRAHAARWLHERGPDRARGFHVLHVGPQSASAEILGQGTLFIPRLDALDNAQQTALLRLLDDVLPGHPPRVIASASESVLELVGAGRVSAELYFRLAVIVLRVPALRERPDDLPFLLEHFLKHHSDALKRPAPSPSPQQIARLKSYSWPGNLRELSNLAERATVIGPAAFDQLHDPHSPTEMIGPASLRDGFSLSEHLEVIERNILLRAIEQSGGDRTEMGRLLGLERNTLRYKLTKHGLLEKTERTG